ncbi:site-specific DNA-methyltransferase [Methylocystis parvus]|uniref:site-specific DNA-methyltransferase (adenine-specific) n=2 Tax=Methylocystis parvus TaxID=134 RepID=A0A6B8MAP2_9HYPH|nr:site-specific DNA-methyltransferase [Methylocystis parvus]
MKKLEAGSPDTKSTDIVAGNVEALKTLFPEAFTEGRIDFEVLKGLLGAAVDERDEKYGLNWHGKRRARQIALTPSTGTLLPCPEESVDWETTQNIMIEGDNLEVLKLLQKSYAGKVKLIYIDPPYNTGKDFVYPDDYRDNIANYLELTGQVEGGRKISSNTEASGRFHTDWLSMMYPRLRLARTLLRDDGAIIVSIDDHEQSNLKTILDEIFGEENFIACVANINNMKGRNDRKHIATAHEYFLIYSKREFDSYGVPLTDEQLKDYKYVDERGERYALRDLRKRGRPDRREDRPNMFFPIFYNPETKACALQRRSTNDVEIVPKRGDMSDGRWRWGLDTVRDNLAILHANYSKQKDRWDISHRVYLNKDIEGDIDEESDDDDNIQRTSKPKSFWWGGENSTDVASREFKILFPGLNPDYPKSPFLMEKIVHMGSKPGDLVLDFFAGFGTTGHAVFRLNRVNPNRRFILVQLQEEISEEVAEQTETYKYCKKNGIKPFISEITKERLRRAASLIKSGQHDQKSDFGFRVFKLAPSNIRAWEPDPADIENSLLNNAEHLVQGRSEQDVLYELLLKLGLDLCVPIETKTIAGKAVHSIGGGALIVCLADGLTKDVIESLASGIVTWREALAPAVDTRVVFKDSGFKDDIAKTNMAAILNQNGISDVRGL